VEADVSQGGAGFDPRVLFTHWDGLKDMAAILGTATRRSCAAANSTPACSASPARR